MSLEFVERRLEYVSIVNNNTKKSYNLFIVIFDEKKLEILTGPVFLSTVGDYKMFRITLLKSGKLQHKVSFGDEIKEIKKYLQTHNLQLKYSTSQLKKYDEAFEFLTSQMIKIYTGFTPQTIKNMGFVQQHIDFFPRPYLPIKSVNIAIFSKGETYKILLLSNAEICYLDKMFYRTIREIVITYCFTRQFAAPNYHAFNCIISSTDSLKQIINNPNMQNRIELSENSKDPNVQLSDKIILMPVNRVGSSLLLYVNNKSDSFSDIKPILISLLFDLFILHTKMHVMHGDLHLGNILIEQSLKSINQILYIKFSKTQIFKITTNIHMRIIDFSHCVLSSKYYKNDKFLQEEEHRHMLVLYSHFFSSFYEKNKERLSEFLEEHPFIFFKQLTMIDLYMTLYNMKSFGGIFMKDRNGEIMEMMIDFCIEILTVEMEKILDKKFTIEYLENRNFPISRFMDRFYIPISTPSNPNAVGTFFKLADKAPTLEAVISDMKNSPLLEKLIKNAPVECPEYTETKNEYLSSYITKI